MEGLQWSVSDGVELLGWVMKEDNPEELYVKEIFFLQNLKPVFVIITLIQQNEMKN